VVTIRSYRVLIAAAVPILAMSLASLGRTGAAARDITDLGAVRRVTNCRDPRIPVPDPGRAPVRTPRPAPKPLAFRNPFEFAPSRLPATSALPQVSPAPPPETPPVVPPGVALSLIGVAATSHGDGRVERTAIITGPADALYFVGEGDAVRARYRVDAVLPDSVRLVDFVTGASVSLIIR
jgi:hypothetical protein